MNRLLIATTNPAKLAEYRILLRQMGIDLEPMSLGEAGITEVAEENGDDFPRQCPREGAVLFRRSKSSHSGR